MLVTSVALLLLVGTIWANTPPSKTRDLWGIQAMRGIIYILESRRVRNKFVA